MNVTVLGSSGWYDAPTGSTTCLLVETAEQYILLDAGLGLAKADAYITKDKPVWLFLSHLHLDHLYGVHVLVKFRFPQGLKIAGHAGFAAPFRTLAAEPYTVPLEKLPYPVELIELQEGDNSELFPGLTAAPLRHSITCWGYRFELEGKVLTFCTDTGVTDSAVELARDADLFITECSHPPGHEDGGWGHLNPADAAGMAKAANAKRMLLAHFTTYTYPAPERRAEAANAAREIFPNTDFALDGMQIVV